MLNLADDGGRYQYNVAAVGNKIQLTSRLTLYKPVYGAEEYANLRESYRLMLEKQAGKLAIRKRAWFLVPGLCPGECSGTRQSVLAFSD